MYFFIVFFFFFNDTATTEIYTLSLHDALPIYRRRGGADLRRDIAGRKGGSLCQSCRCARQRHRHGLPGDQPDPDPDGGAEPLSRQGTPAQPAARSLYFGAAVLPVAEFRRRPDGSGLLARRCEETDGRDCACRTLRRPDHHFRRT